MEHGTNYNDVAKTHPNYQAAMQYWDDSDALFEGTNEMRKKGKTFLPKHEAESEKGYESRLSKSFLVNRYAQAVNTLKGKLSTNAVIYADTSPRIQEILENVNLEGDDLNRFNQDLTKDAIKYGSCHTLVDTYDDWQSESAADDENRRPYVTRICPKDLIYAVSDNVRGMEQASHIRFRVTRKEMVGFTETTYNQIKVLEMINGFMHWSLYEQDKKTKNWHPVMRESENGELFELVQVPTDITYIPIRTRTLGEKIGFMYAKPVYSELISTNIEHWQIYSNYKNTIEFKGFDLLTGYGLPKDFKFMEVGPRTLISFENPQGFIKSVELAGTGLDAALKHLERVEDEMELQSLRPYLLQRTGDATASGDIIRKAETDSPIKIMADATQDHLEGMIGDINYFLNGDREDYGELSYNFDFAMPSLSNLANLLQARALGDISRVTLLNEFKRYGVLDDSFSIEEDDGFLTVESPNGSNINGFQSSGDEENNG